MSSDNFLLKFAVFAAACYLTIPVLVGLHNLIFCNRRFSHEFRHRQETIRHARGVDSRTSRPNLLRS